MAKKTAQHTKITSGVYYRILSARSGKAMEADANNRIQMYDVTNAANQFWAFEPADGDGYRIVNRQSGEVVDVILAGTENGAQIHQWEDVGAENQKWLLVPAANGC